MRASSSSCANAFSKVAAAALVAIAWRAAGEVVSPKEAAAAPSGNVAVTPAPALAADPYEAGDPTAAKSIGHTSYVLKLRLAAGLVAAYKPQSTLPLGDRRYRGEIAAYRLGRALGLDNVPRAIPRSFAASKLAAAFSTAEGRADFARKAGVDENGSVRGALLPWIDGYEELPLDQPAWRTKWIAWLTREDAVIAPEDRKTARDISTMLAFDFLTANWDRWSGGNVARDRASGTILFVDNDGAFYDTPPAANLAAQLARLRRVVRFSRSFVAAVRALDGASLRRAIGDESPGHRLLPDAVLAGVDARRTTFLGVVDERIAREGEAAALAFE